MRHKMQIVSYEYGRGFLTATYHLLTVAISCGCKQIFRTQSVESGHVVNSQTLRVQSNYCTVKAHPNIALNKPCIQSGTYTDNDGIYTCSFAVDGSKTTISSATELQDEPFWQLDLQGYYIVSNISVSSDDSFWSVSINSAKIAITTNDMVCNNGKVFECGQWPSTDHRDQTIVFTCTDVTPVRYIRVWREENGYLVIRELKVKGEPWKTFGMSFERVDSTQLSTPVSTLGVSYKVECATACYETQPCIAFSYSSSESPNCILASHLTNTSEAAWDTYNVDECFEMDMC